MAKNRDRKTIDWFDKFNPTCNITGLLMFMGCASVVYFTYHSDWDAYGFTVAFSVIMTGGKGMKILDKKFGGKK